MILRCLAVSFFYRALSERHLLGNGDGLAIPHSCDVANQSSFLIGHANFHRGNLRMVSHIHSLSAKHIAFLGTRHKHDAVADAEGQLSATIHQGCYRQVGQGKQCPTLTNVSTIQMHIRHLHLCHSMLLVHLRNPATCIGCKPVRAIQ